VNLNVEVAVKGTMVECRVSLDACEPIFEMPPMTEGLLHGVATGLDNIKE
jgi:hypothetical protein